MEHKISNLSFLKLYIRIFPLLELSDWNFCTTNSYCIGTILYCFYTYIISHLFRSIIDELISLSLFSDIGLLVRILHIA